MYVCILTTPLSLSHWRDWLNFWIIRQLRYLHIPAMICGNASSLYVDIAHMYAQECSPVFAGGTWDNAGPIDYPILHIYACTSRLRHLCASPSRHNSQVHIRSNRGGPRCLPESP